VELTVSDLGVVLTVCCLCSAFIRFIVATKANPFTGFNENLRPENVVAQVRV